MIKEDFIGSEYTVTGRIKRVLSCCCVMALCAVITQK